MAKFDELKEKAMNLLGSVADITKDAATRTADTTKSLARVAKLSVDVTNEKEVVKKAYYELGKLYYEKHDDENAEEFFAEPIRQLTMTLQIIEELEREIEELKASVRDKPEDGIEVEFEEIVSEYEETIPTVDADDIEPIADDDVAVVVADEEAFAIDADDFEPIAEDEEVVADDAPAAIASAPLWATAETETAEPDEEEIE